VRRHREGGRGLGNDAFGHGRRDRATEVGFDEDRELVRAEAEDPVPGPRQGSQATREENEHLVPDRVAERVVHLGELVDVDLKQYHLAVLGPQRLQAPGQLRSGRQPGQGIAAGLTRGRGRAGESAQQLAGADDPNPARTVQQHDIERA